jgi:putative ABC transport system permease protein
VTGFVGALIEAWDELRLHKLRVLLALVGVTVAVTAITAVSAAVDMLGQAYREQNERNAGRPVTLQISTYPNGWDGRVAPDVTAVTAALDQAVERYGIAYTSREMSGPIQVRFPAGTTEIGVQAVDPDYGIMRRMAVTEGRWFTDEDALAYSPQLVVNEAFLKALHVADLLSHPTVLVGGASPVRATIIGVLPTQWEGEGPRAFWLYDQLERWEPPGQSWGVTPMLWLWVPPDQADALSAAVVRDVQGQVPGWEVNSYDNRQSWSGGIDGATRWIGLGVGAFALLLGGLGLLNISLVTVRYRIREIGIRRSFGATSARIFFGVVLESAVATVVAGVVGVALAVTVIKAIPVEKVFGGSIQDLPPFPISAVLTGLGAALAVGLLAGVVPATRAVRIKVIDAIRY